MPEKLEGNRSGSIFANDHLVIMLPFRKEFAAEIVKRYNAYLDQQAIIERQKQQIEYWQQLCREKGVEIIDKSPKENK